MSKDIYSITTKSGLISTERSQMFYCIPTVTKGNEQILCKDILCETRSV